MFFCIFYTNKMIPFQIFVTHHSYSINPLTPEGDQHLISPYNITPKSHIKVTRRKKMISNDRSSRLLNKFSQSAPQEMYFLRAIEIFYCAHFAEPLVFLNISQGKSQHNFIQDSTHLLLLTRYNAKILSFSRYCRAFLTYCLPLWFCARLRRLTRHTTPRIFFFKAESFF